MLCQTPPRSSEWSLLVASGLQSDPQKLHSLMELFPDGENLIKADSDSLPSNSEISSKSLIIILDLTSIDNADAVINHLQIEFPDARFVALFDSEARESYSNAVMLKARYGKPHGFIPVTANADTCAAILCIVTAGGEIMPWTHGAYAVNPTAFSQRRDAVDLAASSFPAVMMLPEGHSNGGLKEVPLTEREKQVLRLLMTGMQNKVIANKMGISENTIRIHIHHILRKLGVRNRTEAANAGIRSGFFSLMLFCEVAALQIMGSALM